MTGHKQKDLQMPKSAFLAVTLLCNSRCIMCDIWKNKGFDFLPLEIYRKLPDSLEVIGITGGEPFLRNDLPEMVTVLKETCPRARIVITTHGFMTDKIAKQAGDLLAADPHLSIRVSLDGLGKIHEEIRGVPEAFEKAAATLDILRKRKVKDLGVIFTLMRQNAHQLLEVFRFCRRRGLKFSLNIAHDSPVYFGEGKVSLNPEPAAVKETFDSLFWNQLASWSPKDWAKAWFNRYFYTYLLRHQRPFICGAGEHLFYMDSHADIYMCQFKNWPLGNLRESSFLEIWSSRAKHQFVTQARQCHDCWMICTARDALRERKSTVLKEISKLIWKTLRRQE